MLFQHSKRFHDPASLDRLLARVVGIGQEQRFHYLACHASSALQLAMETTYYVAWLVSGIESPSSPRD